MSLQLVVKHFVKIISLSPKTFFCRVQQQMQNYSKKLKNLHFGEMFTTAFYSKRNQPIRHSLLKTLQYVAY